MSSIYTDADRGIRTFVVFFLTVILVLGGPFVLAPIGWLMDVVRFPRFPGGGVELVGGLAAIWSRSLLRMSQIVLVACLLRLPVSHFQLCFFSYRFGGCSPRALWIVEGPPRKKDLLALQLCSSRRPLGEIQYVSPVRQPPL